MKLIHDSDRVLVSDVFEYAEKYDYKDTHGGMTYYIDILVYGQKVPIEFLSKDARDIFFDKILEALKEEER